MPLGARGPFAHDVRRSERLAPPRVDRAQARVGRDGDERRSSAFRQTRLRHS
jgi:hypothetical protein